MIVRNVVLATDGSALAARAEPTARWAAGVWDARFEPVTIVGDVVDGLVAAITEVDSALPCLATHARNRSAPVLGSVAQGLLEATWEPALLVGPSARVAPDGPIVVVVEGHEDDHDLLEVAGSWAQVLTRPIWLVTVVEPVLAGADGHIRRARGPEDPDAHLTALSAMATAPVRSIVIDDPIGVADGLGPFLERTKPCLVVVGHRWHSRTRQVVVGDRSAAIVAASPVPALVVPVGLHR